VKGTGNYCIFSIICVFWPLYGRGMGHYDCTFENLVGENPIVDRKSSYQMEKGAQCYAGESPGEL